MISVMNAFVKQVLPQAIVRELSAEEKAHYEAPYPTIASRKALCQWPCEVPIDGKPADVHQAVAEYNRKLQESELPKILFHATPGGIINEELLGWCKNNLKHLQTVDIGKGIHFIQEDNPSLIGEELAKWYEAL